MTKVVKWFWKKIHILSLYLNNLNFEYLTLQKSIHSSQQLEHHFHNTKYLPTYIHKTNHNFR